LVLRSEEYDIVLSPSSVASTDPEKHGAAECGLFIRLQNNRVQISRVAKHTRFYLFALAYRKLHYLAAVTVLTYAAPAELMMTAGSGAMTFHRYRLRTRRKVCHKI
jgi:hypothetical protein